MADSAWLAVAVVIADLLIRVGLSIRVVMRRLSVGVALAWILILISAPLVGAVIYLFFGELRLGKRRARWVAQIEPAQAEWSQRLQAQFPLSLVAGQEEFEPLQRLIDRSVGITPTPGNQIQLINDAEPILRRIIADIDLATKSCHLEFYIWHPGGTADEVAEALMRASNRGVQCRVLLDDVGSREFLRGPLAKRLRGAGVELQAALPVGLLRVLFARLDLRLHRKIVVIDHRIGYTGSLNLVDPRYFKTSSHVGEWVDAMVRVEGPAVEWLGAIFAADWDMETRRGSEAIALAASPDTIRAPLAEMPHRAVVQVIPTGPLTAPTAAQEILVTALYAARHELIMTTPYFVPDDALLMALVSAARRGVAVTLIVPARVDSRLVRWASQAHKDDLLAAGVRVALFEGGLLHTKSVTIDGQLSLFGSLNLDPRSLKLNFEITMAMYDTAFTAELRRLQQSYLLESQEMSLAQVQQRPYVQRLGYNMSRLLTPLL